LVTGANGLVGAAAVRALRTAGASVVRVTHGWPAAGRGDEIVTDLAQGASALVELADLPCDMLVHLAAALPHNPRYPDDDQSADISRRIDATVLSFCRRRSLTCIYASTCGLYDPADGTAKTESSPVTPRSPYFRVKADGEAAFLDLPGACVVRLSAPYGPGLWPTTVLGRFIRAIKQGKTITVWGTGRREQDFIHVDDVATCLVSALTVRAGGIFNVASGKPLSMRTLASTLVAIAGTGNYTVGEVEDPQEFHTARFSILKAAVSLDWTPRVEAVAGLKELLEMPVEDAVRALQGSGRN